MAFTIDEVFQYHKTFGDQALRYQVIRDEAKGLAALINRDCPESREKSLAFTKLQEAVMWANAAIAINEKEV